MNRMILVAGFLLAGSFVNAQAQTNELSAQTSEPPAQMQNSEAQQMMSDPDRTYYIAICSRIAWSILTNERGQKLILRNIAIVQLSRWRIKQHKLHSIFT